MRAATRKIRRAIPATAALALAALLAAPAAAPAQSAQEVLETAFERHEQRMEGVENYTVVQEVMGFEATTYFERVERDGHVFFVPRQQMGSEAAQRAPENPYAALEELASRATLSGTEQVDGETVHVVEVTDLEGTELQRSMGGEGEFDPEKATFLVDTDDYLVRGMRMRGTTTAGQGGQAQDFSFDARFSDYREVEGMVHPFRVSVSVEGVGGQMTPEQRQQARQSLEQMRQQMENMSEQQRQMMERMMGDQMERVEQMLASGAMDFAVQVKELRVNEGPPSGQGGG